MCVCVGWGEGGRSGRGGGGGGSSSQEPSKKKMAAGSDLLDEVFLNTEVDEKVVSDLVGSLESQLAASGHHHQHHKAQEPLRAAGGLLGNHVVSSGSSSSSPSPSPGGVVVGGNANAQTESSNSSKMGLSAPEITKAGNMGRGGGLRGRGALPSPHSPAPSLSAFPPFPLSPSRCGRSGSAKGGIDHTGESLPSSCPLGVCPRLCSLPFIFPPRSCFTRGCWIMCGGRTSRHCPAGTLPVPSAFPALVAGVEEGLSESGGAEGGRAHPLGHGCASRAVWGCSPSLPGRGGYGGIPS